MRLAMEDDKTTKARFPLAELTARVLTGDRFPFPVNTGRIDGPSKPVLTGNGNRPLTRAVNSGIVETGLKSVNK